MANRVMKDSGIDWIGTIPRNWIVSKIKYVIEYISSGTTPSSTKLDYYDGNYNWIQSGDLYNKEEIYETEKTVTSKALFEISSLHIFKKDFIVVAMYGASIGNVAISKIDACTNQACCVLKNNNKYLLKFLYYILKANYNIMIKKSIGGTQPNISQILIKNLNVLLPSLKEQKLISDYLDNKCSEINKLKEDITKQINILKEYKQSVITEAVTKGLNSNVPMKNSGIDWIGDIPKNWKIIKSKYIFTERFSNGNNLCLQLLSPTQKYGVIPQKLYEKYSTQRTVKINNNKDLSSFKTIKKGDYCISLRSFQGGFEYSSYEGVVSPAYKVFYPKTEINRYYFKYLFKDKGFISKIASYSDSLRDGKSISFNEFGNTLIPVPPLLEQKIIANYLDNKCAEIDKIISSKEEQLNTLDEYKKSLIYEYVTGKKEVPQKD